MRRVEGNNSLFHQLFSEICPRVPCKANYFLHFLQCKLLFESHNSAEPHLLFLGNPSQGLFHISQFKEDFVVLHQVVLPGHSWSSHSVDVVKG